MLSLEEASCFINGGGILCYHWRRHLVLSLEEASCVITGGGNPHFAILRPQLASGYNISAVQYGNLRLEQTFTTFSQGYNEEEKIYMPVAISINIKSIKWLKRI